MICSIGTELPTGTGTKDVVIIPFRNFNSIADDYETSPTDTLTVLSTA